MDATRQNPRPTTVREFVQRAVAMLEGQGWKVHRTTARLQAPWHIIAHKGEKWRIVQVVLPATSPAERQESRLLLGNTVRLPSNMGTMEQWLAHVRPDGIATFGPYILNGQRWADGDGQTFAQLGLIA
jgi:hypothetical protein